MSEFINNREKRIEGLIKFSMGMMEGKDGRELIEEYREAIENATPHDILLMEDRQVRLGIKPSQIKKHIEKILNVLNPHLSKYNWDKPEEGHPIYYFMKENRELENFLKKMKGPIKKIELDSKEDVSIEIPSEMSKLNDYLAELKKFNKHYIRKENILFPYLEQKWDFYRPLRVMWSVHDDIREEWKKLTELLQDNQQMTDQIRKHLGILFMLMFKMIFKEEKILYPVAVDALDDEEWVEISKQSQDVGYVFIEPDDKGIYKTESNKQSSDKNRITDSDNDYKPEQGKRETGVQGLEDINLDNQNLAAGQVLLGLGTGAVNIEELIRIFNTLPIDITYVDENDRVKYYSNPADRIFPRSPAIIGRSVQNCHPPESVHVVEKILTSFKSGERDRARFWINMNGKTILIDYYALRDSTGNYRGTLEVSQDITEIKKIEGEKRLIDWGA